MSGVPTDRTAESLTDPYTSSNSILGPLWILNDKGLAKRENGRAFWRQEDMLSKWISVRFVSFFLLRLFWLLLALYWIFSFDFSIRLFGRERVVEPAGVRGYADVCVELHYGQVQHH